MLQGDQDAVAPLELTGRRAAAGVRGAKLQVYCGAPHGLFVTHYAAGNRDIAAFAAA